jgi:hypothetical protein
MSLRQIAPDAALTTLRSEGFNVEVRDQHILLHDVPYVSASKHLGRGTLVSTYLHNGQSVIPPDNHQVWWTGDYPCFANGSSIEALRNEDGARDLFPGCHIRHRFSNKPDGYSNFPDHYTKLTHYAMLIQAQAKALDPLLDARSNASKSTFPDEINETPCSPFVYPDSASARASIQTISARLTDFKIGIVGLGGTGSYILDQIAKTPVQAIHLFDGDEFLQHNAFRAPGAVSESDFVGRPNKADFFRSRYEVMHRGIVSHPTFIDETNLLLLDQLDFVFLSVDRGQARAQIVKYLVERKIAFIDVGMNLHLATGASKLIGTCRVTLVTEQLNSHLSQYVPMDDDDDDAVYHQNIQIADMNAMNAQLAVMKWKQHCGFYQDDFAPHNLTFSVNTMSLVRSAGRSS